MQMLSAMLDALKNYRNKYIYNKANEIAWYLFLFISKRFRKVLFVNVQ